MIPDEHLYNTRRRFPCDVCRKVTPWRDSTLGVEVPVCSEACRAKMLDSQIVAEAIPMPQELMVKMQDLAIGVVVDFNEEIHLEEGQVLP